MSAIAARRAAAAEAAAAIVAQVVEQVVVEEPSLDIPRESEESAESEPESVSEEEEPQAPSPKRRKTKKQESQQKKSRYFSNNDSVSAKESPETVQSVTQKLTRHFSPSGSTSEHDASDSEAAVSMGDSDEDMAEDVYDEAREEVDEGRMKWSAPVTPGESSSGPSRAKRSLEQGIQQSHSNFDPKANTNIYKVTDDILKKAGVSQGTGMGIVISLGQDEDLKVAGIFTLTPLQGNITLYSTSISPSIVSTPYPVFAPTSHPLPTISPSSSSSPASSPLLDTIKLPSSFLKTKERTLFLIREHRCGLDGLRLGAVPGFTNIWLEVDGVWGLQGVHPVVGSFPNPVYPYVSPPSWDAALSALPSFDSSSELDPSDPFVALIKGSKRSGKSTFARALLNNLLGIYASVAWLECDLGQGEFGCGGVVGLWVIEKPVFGPPFSHPTIPVQARYLGAYTPTTCPDEYIAAIRSLVEYYKYELQFPVVSDTSSSTSKISGHIPLVINTQGWVKGLGEDLLHGIEAITEPNWVFSFKHQAEGGVPPGWTSSPQWQNSQLPYDPAIPVGMMYAPEGIEVSERQKVFELEQAAASPLLAKYTPADLRVLSTITYFHSALPAVQSAQIKWDLASPLLAIPPYSVTLSSSLEAPIAPLRKVYLIGEGSEGVLAQDLGLALNGAVVALIETDDFEAEEGGMYEQGRVPPPVYNTLGLALIRSLSPLLSSPEGGFTLHILTPLPPATLARANGIIKNGALELPLPGMLDWRRGGVNEEGMVGVRWEEVPYLVVGGADVVGGERKRWRRNVGRKGM